MQGKVYLVGAGPGDPGLITVKGLECIQKADVLIKDYLASPILSAYTPKHTEIIYVGKKAGDHCFTQDQINALIVKKAKEGLTVVRLKGGDPFVFGRGGEEAEELIKAEIPFEIVPGVTSAIAVPAYAGIPLTHRKYTSTLAIVTGHENPTKKESNIDWKALATGIGTIVFLMGVKNLTRIAQQLMHYGKRPDTPVAVIRWGTTPKQVTVTGTLETIAKRVANAGLKAPAIIVVGDVVELRESLKWYENRPLMGKTIVVTRARQQASELVNRLAELGAECLECPTIKVVPPKDTRPLEAAIKRISTYDWLVFTSVNGVNFFFEHLFAMGRDVRALHHIKTAVVGPVTEQRLFDFGIKSDIMPESYRAESVIKAFAGQDINGEKILLPRAKKARSVLPVELTKMGAVVDDVTAYENQAVTDNAAGFLTRLKEGSINLVTFTSSSTVNNFHALLPADALETLMKDVVIASIGPITADTARDLGFKVDIMAEPYTIPGLCEAIRQYYQK
ncbi:MAG: uroporphyrinogen-III C-methyltransferase [Candidatus Desulfatibia sp.]|uniref:uroporphyrinogen-III C-methyltransferase n=1 Tax=Candidatus Desulfatibia sp. TaxID=3101189 RepID=UPI002F339265